MGSSQGGRGPRGVLSGGGRRDHPDGAVHRGEEHRLQRGRQEGGKGETSDRPEEAAASAAIAEERLRRETDRRGDRLRTGERVRRRGHPSAALLRSAGHAQQPQARFLRDRRGIESPRIVQALPRPRKLRPGRVRVRLRHRGVSLQEELRPQDVHGNPQRERQKRPLRRSPQSRQGQFHYRPVASSQLFIFNYLSIRENSLSININLPDVLLDSHCLHQHADNIQPNKS